MTLVIIIDFFLYGPSWAEIASEANVATFNLDLFSTFSLTFIAFIIHQFIFPIRKELHNPTLRRQSKIWMRQTIACVTIYSLVCVAGYLNFLEETATWITSNYNGEVFLIGKIGMCATLFFGVPMTILACRSIIHDMLLSDEMEYQLKHKNFKITAEDGKIVFEVDSVDSYRNRIHMYSTLGLQFTSAALAILVPEITYGACKG